MKYGNTHAFPKLRPDFKTRRCANVFKVNATKWRPKSNNINESFDANGPIAPRPRTAVPLVTTPTRLARAVIEAASLAPLTMSSHAAATPGE